MNEMTLPRNAPSTLGPAPVRSTSTTTSTSAREGSLVRTLWRGPQDDPAWARPALLGLLLATAAFYFWNLTSNGWANSFYSAAVQAGSESWTAFFFGSSDAANSITVDKPPASLWVMALSVRLFGLSSFSILLPEVLMGVASVGVLYATVKRQFGASAGLIAGGILALTPVAVLMFRFNNPEALLVLLMTLAAWATMRSIEKSSPKWFMIVGVFIGLAFLTKTLQAFLVVPGFALAYLVAAKPPLLKRIWHTVLGGLAIVVSAGWWVAVVELLPESMRPYIGGSQTNSFLELTFGYNGLGRINGEETGSVGGGGNWGTTGLWRLFNSENGGQISWLHAGRTDPARRRPDLPPRLPAHRPAPRGIPRLGLVVRRDRARLLPHGRHLPRVLHDRPRPGRRRARRDGRPRGVGAAGHRVRRDQPGRGDGRHQRLGVPPALAGHHLEIRGCASPCSPWVWRPRSGSCSSAGCTAGRCRHSSGSAWSPRCSAPPHTARRP